LIQLRVKLFGVIVDQLLDAGVTEFVFVIAIWVKRSTRYIENLPKLVHTFVTQNDRRVRACYLAQKMPKDDDVMIVLVIPYAIIM